MQKRRYEIFRNRYPGILRRKIAVFEKGINTIRDTNYLGQYLLIIIGYGRQPQPPS